jgi:hypothetical protein
MQQQCVQQHTVLSEQSSSSQICAILTFAVLKLQQPSMQFSDAVLRLAVACSSLT